MALILPFRRSGFPGGRPGFSYGHFANVGKGCRFSAIPAVGSGFINVLSGLRGTGTQTGPYTIDGAIGPVSIGNNSTANGSTFAIMPAAVDAGITFAGFYRISAFTQPAGIIVWGTNNAGPGLMTDGSGNFYLNNWNGTNCAAVIPTSVGTPYFVIASAGATTAGTCNLLALNLLTGKIQTATSASQNMTAPNGVIAVGVGNPGNAYGALGSIGPVAYIGGYLSLQQMRQWAQDPWSFWYPKQLDLVDCLGPPPAAAVTIKGGTLPLMGVG